MFKEQGNYSVISTGFVQLLAKRGHSLTAIAKMAGVTKSFISRVNGGTRSLTLDHLTKLERAVGEPLPWLWLESIPLKSIPAELRPLYHATKKLVKPMQRRARRKREAA